MNLGPIEEINSIEIDGVESYVVKSLVKKKPFSLVSNPRGFSCVGKHKFKDNIKNLFSLKDRVGEYVVVSFWNTNS